MSKELPANKWSLQMIMDNFSDWIMQTCDEGARVAEREEELEEEFFREGEPDIDAIEEAIYENE